MDGWVDRELACDRARTQVRQLGWNLFWVSLRCTRYCRIQLVELSDMGGRDGWMDGWTGNSHAIGREPRSDNLDGISSGSVCDALDTVECN